MVPVALGLKRDCELKSGNAPMKHVFVSCTLLTVCLACCAQEKGAPGEVKWVGEMRKVMRDGDLSGTVKLDALAKLPQLYALGPLEGLRGEITIVDGTPSIGAVVDGKATVGDKLEGKACMCLL